VSRPHTGPRPGAGQTATSLHTLATLSTSPPTLPPTLPILPTPRRGGGAWAFLLAIATAGALAHVAVRFKGLEVAYALGRERKIGSELEEQQRRLQIEIGMLKDPNRVVSIARERLKMGPPAPDAIRRLGTGSLLVPPSAPTEPTPAQAERGGPTSAPAPAPAPARAGMAPRGGR
jgi:cell division protein FtsL